MPLTRTKPPCNKAGPKSYALSVHEQPLCTALLYENLISKPHGQLSMKWML